MTILNKIDDNVYDLLYVLEKYLWAAFNNKINTADDNIHILFYFVLYITCTTK
jgi:hypothetical protein